MRGPEFDYTIDFKAIDFRKQPNLYRVGKGEQGVMLVEPYNSEIIPHWRFKTVAEAKKSSAKIYKMFLASPGKNILCRVRVGNCWANLDHQISLV